MSEYRIVVRSLDGDPNYDEWVDKFNRDWSWYATATRAAAMFRAGYRGVVVETSDDGETWTEVDGWMSAGNNAGPVYL